MTDSEAAKIVRGVLCRGLSPEQADQIVRAMVAVPAPPGTVVIRENDRPQGLFVLLVGTVEVTKSHNGRNTEPLAVIDAPSVLGEMSLVLDRPHSATVVARTACDFRLLTKAQFDRLISADSLAAYKVVLTLAQVIAQRLYRMDEKVLELTARRDAPVQVEELDQFKRKLFSEWSF